MRIPLAVAIATLVATVVLPSPLPRQSAAPTPPLPDRDVFMARVRSAVRVDPDLQKDFTFIERRRDVKVSALGKVSVGPLRTFEVFPAADPARTYKRLIAVEGKPLDPAEQREREEAHERDLAAEERRQLRETPAQRARRLERGERERRERLAILEDALRVFQASIVSREVVDGETMIVVALTPRAGADATTREGNWMRVFEGRGWFVERDGQMVRLDMHAVDDVSIGWGIVGRLHKGSRIVVERRPIRGVWLPWRLAFDATGRTLLFRTFDLNVVDGVLGLQGAMTGAGRPDVPQGGSPGPSSVRSVVQAGSRVTHADACCSRGSVSKALPAGSSCPGRSFGIPARRLTSPLSTVDCPTPDCRLPTDVPSLMDPHAPLRDDVRMLGELLGETLRLREGQALFETVERVRALSKQRAADRCATSRRWPTCCAICRSMPRCRWRARSRTS